MKQAHALLLVTAALCFMHTSPMMADRNKPLITQPIQNAKRVTLRGNVPSFATQANDLGPLNADAPTGRMYLLLGRSDSAQREMDQYIMALSTPGTAEYHHWMTPEEFGHRFGAHDADIQAVTNWLRSQGFTVEKVPAGKSIVAFSGNAGQVRAAFGTELHRFRVGSAYRTAPVSDPTVPAALAAAVKGVAGMNKIVGHVQQNEGPPATPTMKPLSSGRLKPQLDYPGTYSVDFTPVAGDAAVIYDTPNATLNPAYHGTTYDGTGVTIGALEYTNLSARNLQNVAYYRTTFLGETADQAAAHIPTVVVEGPDPGVIMGGGSHFDGDLQNYGAHAIGDAEISQAMAPGTKTILYVAEDLFLALEGAVDADQVDILINGLDECESQLGAANNAFINEMYEQAAAQGITVVASTGYQGSSGCSSNDIMTSTGFGVAGTASTPWNVAVGGTDFIVLYPPSGDPSKYLNVGSPANNFDGSPPYYTTALGYIPEGVWNLSTRVWTDYNDNVYAGGYEKSGGGGPSSQAVCSGTVSTSTGDCSGSLAGYSKPAYQTGITPSDGVRDLPDISLFTGWAICADKSINYLGDDCQSAPFNGEISGDVGTSAATAAAAGIFAMVVQKEGQRIGLPNPTLYRLYTAVPAAFHDITTSNNAVPCTAGTPNCGANGFLEGYNATTGYDLASGLGSLDVAQLVLNWDNAGLISTGTVLQAGTSSSSLGTGSLSVTHGTPVYFQVNVNPSTATGNVSIQGTAGAIPQVSLSNGSATFSSQSLPGGSYLMRAQYSGDANNKPSASNAISVNVAPEAPTLGATLQSFDPATGKTQDNITSVPYGWYLGLAVTPYGAAGEGKGTPATGTISAASSGVSFGSATLWPTGTGYITIENTAAMMPGSNAIHISYAGDASYQAANSDLPLSVTKSTVSVYAGTGVDACTTLQNDWSVPATCTAGVDILADGIGQPPTGTVTISLAGSSQTVQVSPGPGWLAPTGINLTSAIATTPKAFDVTSFVGEYLPNVFATYNGDGNYLSATGTQNYLWVVPEPAGASFALASSGGISLPSSGGTGTSTITITPASGFVGPVTLSCQVTGMSTVTPVCSIPDTAIVSSRSPVTVTLTVEAPITRSSIRVAAGANGLLAAAGMLLCGLLVRRRRIGATALLAVLACVGLWTTACSGGGSGNVGGSVPIPTGTYTVTITGVNPNFTPTSAGYVSNPITSSATVQVTVN